MTRFEPIIYKTPGKHGLRLLRTTGYARRLLPKSLDLLAALGDDRARELTLENEHSPKVRKKFRRAVEDIARRKRRAPNDIPELLGLVLRHTCKSSAR